MTNSKHLFSSKNRFLILLRYVVVEPRRLDFTDVVSQQKKLLGTATAREILVNRSRKMSRLERRVMVEDFVNNFREINAGKFPSIIYVKKHLGGCHYKVRAILQEMQHNNNIKESAMPKVANTSTFGNKSQAKEISVVGVTSSCLMRDSTAAVDNLEPKVESDISHDEVVVKNSCQKLVDLSNTSNNHEKTVEHVCSGEEKAKMELRGERCETSGVMVTTLNNRTSKGQEALGLAIKVEKTSSTESITMDDSKSPAMPGQPANASGTSKDLEPEEVEAFKASQVIRVATTYGMKEKKLQESSLWGNLKGLASNIVSFWRNK